MKSRRALYRGRWPGHPPRGGCGLKWASPFAWLSSRVVPSTRRVWIEMTTAISPPPRPAGHPPRGGCGLKFLSAAPEPRCCRHPPRGGCGLKFNTRYEGSPKAGSPSTRRVWIEICRPGTSPDSSCHPPRGGCGLKFKLSGGRLGCCRHPPRGGCGLKYSTEPKTCAKIVVTLHAEGVD